MTLEKLMCGQMGIHVDKCKVVDLNRVYMILKLELAVTV